MTPDSPDGFMKALNQLIINSALRTELESKNREKALEIDGKIMEQREMEAYRQIINKKGV